uniref:ESCRT-related protein CHMP1B n=1 Tax=Tanacetum cinerariifolium TaxID=118510 RepID=A0A699H0P2_TANCI|nr:ESCRT-related protein CHMP1B [Tanacetum cinerariifolium]
MGIIIIKNTYEKQEEWLNPSNMELLYNNLKAPSDTTFPCSIFMKKNKYYIQSMADLAFQWEWWPALEDHIIINHYSSRNDLSPQNSLKHKSVIYGKIKKMADDYGLKVSVGLPQVTRNTVALKRNEKVDEDDLGKFMFV